MSTRNMSIWMSSLCCEGLRFADEYAYNYELFSVCSIITTCIGQNKWAKNFASSMRISNLSRSLIIAMACRDTWRSIKYVYIWYCGVYKSSSQHIFQREKPSNNFWYLFARFYDALIFMTLNWHAILFQVRFYYPYI